MLYIEYDPKALDNLIETQQTKINIYIYITDYMKKHKYIYIYITLFKILIVRDDFANDPSFTRQSKLYIYIYVCIYVYVIYIYINIYIYTSTI